MDNSFTKNDGFTLIELLVVVAIIGVLAAVSIPYYQSYKIKGYNAVAMSDLRGIVIVEKAFYSDWKIYSSSAISGLPGRGLLVSSGSVNLTVMANTVEENPYNDAEMIFSVSSGVTAQINTDMTATSFLVGTKHYEGNRVFVFDTEPNQTLFAQVESGRLTPDFTPAATSANDIADSDIWK